MKKKNFLKVLSLALSAVVICGLLSGCTDKPAEDGEKTSNSKETKVLNVVASAELTTLFPLNMDVQNLSATRLCYEGLVNYENGEIVPWLATDWKISNEGKTITLNLRDDVVYHDGEKFNAEAVKRVYEFAGKNPNFGAQKGVSALKQIDIVDEFTVAFQYDQPYFGYMSDLSYREVMVCPSPSVIEDGNYQSMNGVVGTGPYVYSEVKNGEYVKFIKNENYWGETPYYDEIYVKYIPEASARLMALQKGEIDVIYGSNMNTWDDYTQALEMDGISGKASDFNSKTINLIVNASDPVLSDFAVREAVAYSIDKQAICDGLTYGYQEPAVGLFPAGNFLSDIPMDIVRNFDTEKAKKLLDDAGWLMKKNGIREKDGNPLVFRMNYDSGEPMNKLIATTIKSQLAEVGMQVETTGQDMMTWWKEGSSGNYGLIIWNTEENTAPQNYYPKMAVATPHGPSLKGIEGGDVFLKNIEKVQAMGNQEEAIALFDEILNFSNTNVLDLPICYVKENILFKEDAIKDYAFTSTPMMFEIDNVIPVE